jgi:hypothetical protein
MLTNREKKRALSVYMLLIQMGSLLIGHLNANVMPYGISLDVSAPPKTKINKW